MTKFDQLLPSPFYRVSIKLIIKNDQDKLLLVRTDEGWEMPGGGWEHGETFDECITREIKEELGVEAIDHTDILFVYKGLNVKNYMAIRLVVKAQLNNPPTQPEDEEILEIRFVTKEELLSLPMTGDEAPIKNYTDQLWPS